MSKIPRLFPPNLEKMRTNRDVNSLVQVLRNSSDAIAEQASGKLIDIGEPAVIPLIQLLKDAHRRNEVKTKERVSRTLTAIGAPAVEALLGVVTGTLWQAPFKYSAYGQAALDILVAIGEPAVEPLIRLLDGGMLSPVAAEALVRIGEPAVPSLAARLGGHTGAENHIVAALVRINTPASLAALQFGLLNGTPEVVAACHRGMATPNSNGDR
jgi:HEAT repeat protein